MYKIGHGFDLHPVKAGGKLVLGCVPFGDVDFGLVGHSDADVVAHAVCDALLGAAGMGDIGEHFPDTDTAYAGAPGSLFLSSVATMLCDRSFRVSNVDCTVLCDIVKLGNRKSDMASAMAAHLGIPPERVNVKATTCEGYGIVGRGEVIACVAVATILQAGP